MSSPLPSKPIGLQRLIPASDRLFLKHAIVMLVLSISLPLVLALGCPKVLRLPGVIAMMGSPVYLLVTLIELVRYQRGWRVWLAFSLHALAFAIVWATTILYATGRMPW
jgi:hypothetical protein